KGSCALQKDEKESRPPPEPHQSRQENEQAPSTAAPHPGVVRGPEVQQYDMSRNPLRINPVGHHQEDGSERRHHHLGNDVAATCRRIERGKHRGTQYPRNKGPARGRASRFARLLRPIHSWVWDSPRRRARKLLRFAETEANGSR